PCIQMSRKTRRGTRSEIAASALSLSCAVRVSCPSSDRMPETISRISASSSTTRISDATCEFLISSRSGAAGRHDMRQQHPDHGATAMIEIGRRVVQFELAAVLFYDLLDDGEAEARALLSHRHIGLQDAVPVFGRQAIAVVDHIDDEAVRAPL